MNRQIWINFLALLPSTALTILVISVAFLRFYDERDFEVLGFINHPRVWGNRLTLAALLAALANFSVEWNRRNRETNRRAEEEQRRAEEEQRRAEEEQRRAGEEQRRAEEEQRRMAEERAEADRRVEEEQRRMAEERAEADRRTEEEQRRMAQERAEADRRAEEREQTTRRARIEARYRITQIRFQLDPNEENRQELIEILAVLEEYGNTL